MIPVLRYWLVRWRRTWTSNLIPTIVLPFLLLASLGLGLGSLVDGAASGGSASGGSGSGGSGFEGGYLAFVAPGLLAATAMQSAVTDTSFPVMTGLKWQRHFEAMIATALRPVDLVSGLLAFVTVRLTLACTVFAGVAVGFDAFAGDGGAAVAATVPAAVLTGLAFAAPVIAFTATLDRDVWLTVLLRFVIMPTYLFAGTFFPLDSLPVPVQVVGWVSPLWHGVELCRGVAGGTLSWTMGIGHVGYLLGWVLVGGWLATRVLRRRLIA